LYHDAGQFYWGKPEAFIDNLEMFSKLSIPVVIPKYLVQDIDDIEDWKRAEVMFKALLSMGEVD
jgi:N-acylneuraminate cytidylyltransferase